MTKRKAWQTLLIMSAIFIMYQMMPNTDETFLGHRRETLFSSGIAVLCSEVFPLFRWNENNIGTDAFLEKILFCLNEETFPVLEYCNNYWENADDWLKGKTDIPEYYLESDEGKEETEGEVNPNINQTESKKYSATDLNDYHFLLKNFYTVDSTTTVASGELNGALLASKDLSIPFSIKEPKILIYHTHGSENYADSKKDAKEETVIGVGDELARILEEQYSIKVYHDRSLYDMMNGKLDRSKAYTYAGNNVVKILEKYPSIEVVIDLHRDAVKQGTKLVTTVNGKETAKIMFFNGLSRTAKNGDIAYLQNPNKEENLAFSLQMQLAAADLYPGFTRKIYLKGYRYNMHFKGRSLLVEVGAQTNTLEEAKNAMYPLAELLYQVLKEK